MSEFHIHWYDPDIGLSVETYDQRAASILVQVGAQERKSHVGRTFYATPEQIMAFLERFSGVKAATLLNEPAVRKHRYPALTEAERARRAARMRANRQNRKSVGGFE